MNTLYTFKGKVLVLSFAFFAFSYALTDAVKLFAMTKGDIVRVGADEANPVDDKAIPIILLSDGENKKIMTVNEFFRSVSSNPNLTAEDITKVVKLKNEIELGKVQVDLLRKLTEKKEEKKDSFLMGAMKRGGSNVGSKVFGLVKTAAGHVISIATSLVIIGGVACCLWWYLGPTSYPPQDPILDTTTGSPIISDYCHNGVCYPSLCNDAFAWPFGPSDCPR